MNRWQITHPAVILVYYLGMFILLFACMNPLSLALLTAQAIVQTLLYASKSFGSLRFFAPLAGIMFIFSAFVNSRGDTVLLHLGILTLSAESLVRSGLYALMLLDMILLFIPLRALVDGGELMALTSRALPRVTLVTELGMRFGDIYAERARTLLNLSKVNGKEDKHHRLRPEPLFRKRPRLDASFSALFRKVGSPSEPGGFSRIITTIKHYGSILLNLVSWSLEADMRTALSLRASGYAVTDDEDAPKRTVFRRRRLKAGDMVVLAASVLLCTLFIVLLSFGVLQYNILDTLPQLLAKTADIFLLAVIAAYLLIPYIADAIGGIYAVKKITLRIN